MCNTVLLRMPHISSWYCVLNTAVINSSPREIPPQSRGVGKRLQWMNFVPVPDTLPRLSPSCFSSSCFHVVGAEGNITFRITSFLYAEKVTCGGLIWAWRSFMLLLFSCDDAWWGYFPLSSILHRSIYVIQLAGWNVPFTLTQQGGYGCLKWLFVRPPVCLYSPLGISKASWRFWIFWTRARMTRKLSRRKDSIV